VPRAPARARRCARLPTDDRQQHRRNRAQCSRGHRERGSQIAASGLRGAADSWLAGREAGGGLTSLACIALKACKASAPARGSVANSRIGAFCEIVRSRSACRDVHPRFISGADACARAKEPKQSQRSHSNWTCMQSQLPGSCAIFHAGTMLPEYGCHGSQARLDLVPTPTKVSHAASSLAPCRGLCRSRTRSHRSSCRFCSSRRMCRGHCSC
jgi:hypothetical protein